MENAPRSLPTSLQATAPRAVALLASLVLALIASLAVGTQAEARPPTAKGSERAHGARDRGKARKQRGRVSTKSKGNRGRKPLPAPESAPESEPAPTPVPEPTADPEPAPAPAPEPEPAPAPIPTPAPTGTTLFNGDFDAGFRGWYVQSLSGRASLFSSGMFEGSQAARFEVRDGDVEPDTGAERSEVSGPTFDQGQDIYIRDAIRVSSASTYSAPWQIIQQLHEENWSGSPGLAVFLDNSHALKLGAGDGSPTFWQSAPMQAGRWYDLVYRVKLSQDPGAGFVEVWLDGVPQSLLNGQTRMYGQTIQASQTYLKAGIYRSKSSSGTSVVEHDAIVVGSSLSAVTGG